MISRLTIRSRLLLATLLPVLLTAIVLVVLALVELNAEEEKSLQTLEQQLLEARKSGVRDVVQTAVSSIREVMNDPDLTRAEKQEEARDRIRAIRWGDNNYVFLYHTDIVNLAYRPDPSAEGPVENPKVVELIENIIDAARGGGGYHGYDWPNPAADGEVQPKVSYATLIDEWDWMIGAGVYTQDIANVVAQFREEADADIRALFLYMLLAALVVGAVATIIGVVVGRTVTIPLNRVTDTMRDIAEGEGDLTRRLPADGRDELSDLGQQFNAFAEKIQGTIREVSDTTDQLASSAEELSRVATETRESVQSQSSETDQIASAINEMAATVQQIAGNANDAERSASDTDHQAREGGTTIESAQGTVRALVDDMEYTASSINALSEKTGDIQQVLDVIHEVTDQTNLLALNAAIEAARAGEHGRGFAVVADEVRQLAKRSADSASQIREMIEGFIKESSASVDRMGQAKSRTDETMERINHATGALKTIEGSVSRIHDQITQIATAAEQQSQVAEEINKNVTRIVEAAQHSDEGVSQTHQASEELARLGESLRHLVGQFRI